MSDRAASMGIQALETGSSAALTRRRGTYK